MAEVGEPNAEQIDGESQSTVGLTFVELMFAVVTAAPSMVSVATALVTAPTGLVTKTV